MMRFLCFLLFCFPVLLKAQDVKSVEKEWETVFTSLRPAERKVLVENTVQTLTSGFLTEAEKDSVLGTFKSLQELRVSVSPELKNYIGCVNAFCLRQEKSNLLVWLGGLKKVLTAPERRRTLVRNYLINMTPSACEQILFRASSHKWTVRGKCDWSESEEQELRITAEDVDLICQTAKDSIVLYGTSVSYIPGTSQVRGKGGIVKWPDTEKNMSAGLSGYQIDMNMSEYSADSVTFRYEEKFPQPILGKLKDNASKYDRGKKRPYPEFTSYALDIPVDSLFGKLSYRGGISYAGEKFVGFGQGEQLARVHFSPNDTIQMTLYSRRFNIDSARMMSGSARLIIDLDSGEITHPDINFLYTASKNNITLKRITEQSLHLPFKDSYHKILFDMEEIVWPLDSHYMEMKMSSRSGLFKATIESQNFFSDNVYDNIQGLDEINPLNGLLICSIDLSTNTFTLSEYAAFMKKPVDQLRKQIILLSYNDFVDYNEARDEVTLKQRLFDYTRARVGKQDYDDIRFISHPKDTRVNAVMDTRNFNLRIMGVEKFTISTTKDVYVEPSDKTVVMLYNRDMEFNGKLKAGMFDMFGQNLFFSYDKYTINLTKVDSTSMYLAGQNTNLRGEKIKSLIRDIQGDIVIDKPDNKSGKKKDPGYPILNSDKESYVYFDSPSIQEGAYKRDSFYYVIKPYTIKGINDASKFRYAFDGTLISNIVPPIEDTLRLMKDHTLGLTHRTSEKGVELYGKGWIKCDMTLDQKGFLTQGDVRMNQSKFQSDTILLLPQQMNANTRNIAIDAIAGKRPAANGTNVAVKYLVKAGNLQATSLDKPFDVYQGRLKHSGTLFVYEDLLDASGQLELKDAVMKSNLFNLQADNILSNRMNLRILSITNKDIQLNTNDVHANIDLVNNKGKFVNNKESNQAEFSSSQYKCSFKSFTWYMKEAYLNIGIENEEELKQIWKIEDVQKLPEQGRNVFVSTDKQTDSLTFIAPLARYNLNNGDIDCHWVNHIDVANGRFYPGDGNLFINGTGGVKAFTKGRLLCERTDTTKLLTQVDFSLKGRNNFSGSGDYRYVSEERKTTPIRFSEITTDTARLIYARATIDENTPLLLNAGFKYKGDIILHSKQKDLLFKGNVGLTTDQSYLKHNWLAVNHYLQSRHIVIPVSVENRNDKKDRIYNGVFLNVDKTIRPYASFLSNRIFYNDDLLIEGKGELTWSGSLKQYVIRDTAMDRHYHFRYDSGKNLVSAFGKLNLRMRAPGIPQYAAGDIAYDLKEEELRINNLLYVIDFRLLSKMEAVILRDFADKKLKTIAVNPSFMEKVYSVSGKENTAAVNKQLSRTSNNIPDSLNMQLVLDSLYLKWNAKTRSYVSNGDVHVKVIGGKPIEKNMRVKMELVRRRLGDEIFIYLYDDKMWYYFEYTDKTLYTLSSNTEYNDILKNEKADKKIVQTKEKETLYTITLCPDSKKERFLNRVK